MFTRNSVQAACLQVVPRAPLARRPAGGRDQLRRRERGHRRARHARRARDRRPRRRGCSSSTPRRCSPLSTGVIGARLPLHKLLPGLEPAVAALSEDGGADAAEAIMTTDTRPKTAVVARGGFTVGGMAKGSRDDPPRPRDDARGVTTDYPLERRRGDRVPPPGGRAELQRDLGRRRAVHERLRDPARERRERRGARRRRVRRGAERGVRRPRAAGRRRRRGDHRARRDQRHGRASTTRRRRRSRAGSRPRRS